MKHISLRFQLVLCALILCVASSWAVPAYRGWQQRTLADGTTITVRQIGDEFYHYWETQDGQIALEQPDGTFVISDEQAPTGEQIAARRKASKMYQSKPRKTIGERNFAPKGLVILVQFQDVKFKSENNATAFNNMLNQDGYSDGGATGSAKDYFKAQSNEQYVPQFDVFGPVTLPQNLVYYGEQKTVNGEKVNDLYIADFVIDAVKAADDAGCNFANYDSDGDGKVDIVYLFYAGKGQAAGGTSETIWPHNWELLSALYYGRIHSTSTYYCNVNSSGYITSYNLPKHDGKTINNYVCSAELKSSGNRSGIGTLCHEFSHVLGLPDYYDTEYGDNDDNGVTPGTWSLMDQGSYNGDEMTPPNYSIYDKYFMGWATPKFLAVSEKVNVTMTTGYSDAYQITGGSSLLDYNNTSTIYYIENRQKSGWDAGLPASGMLVWQVKYNSTAWSNNEPNNTAGNPRCTIVPADGKTSNYGASSDVFPTGNVKSYKPYNGCELSEITKNNGNISFKYNGGVSATHWDYTLYGEQCTYPTDGTVLKNAELELTITPDEGYTLADAACWDVTMDGSALTYGTDFTYNSSTNKFRIESVTGDVEIIIEGKRTVTWNVAGVTSTSFFSNGAALVLPSTPADCSGDNGKKFVGWTANSTVNGSAPSDLFTEAGSKTVTGNVTYYAVYATATGSGAPHRAKMAGDEYELYSGTLTEGDYLIVYDGVAMNNTVTSDRFQYTTVTATNDKISNHDASIVWHIAASGNYWTVYNASVSKYAAGTGAKNKAQLLASGTDDKSLWTVSGTSTYEFVNKANTTAKVNANLRKNTTYGFACYATSTGGALSLYKKAGSGGGGDSGGSGDYTDYSTACGTPCSNTPTMSFSPATVDKTTADEPFTKTVTITDKGSGQTVAYSSSNVTVATVDNSGKVTLKGVVGSTTITASVSADGDYCAASASYTLTVTAAPIDVTLYYSGTSETLDDQTNPYTLPTTGKYVANMCDDAWTFDGWYGSTYTKSTQKPTYITELTTDGSAAYAVYKTTETSGSGGSLSVVFNFGYSADWGQNASWSGSDKNSVTATKGGVTITHTRGSGSIYANSTATRFYKDNTLTFSVETGSIISIVFTCSTYQTDITSDVGTCTATSSEFSWSGDASSVSFSRPSSASSYAQFSAATITIGGGGSSTTYYATTPECVTPCSNTPVMSFTNASVALTTDDETYTQAVNISGKGSGQTVAYSSSDATVATVDNTGAVTLKGKVGSTTITASVEASGTYCAASASYTLTVSAAPINVTLYYNGTSSTLGNQTNPCILPTTGDYVAAMCSGDWTFDGWYGSTYTKSTQKPTYITELTTDGSAAYAVYKTTETSGSGGSATNLIEYNGVDGRSKLEAIEGVTTNSVADYAAANSPYLLKFDGTGDYIQFELSVVPTSLSFEYKMIGGGSTSTMTIMECATATGDYTDVEALSISGAQNSTGSLTTSNSFSKKYIRMVFTKGSNVGVGSITIVGGGSSSTTYYATTPDCAVTCNLTSITLNTTSAKKTFFVGEQFTHGNVVVTANYSNCDSKTVNGFYTVPDMSSAGTKTVNISYTENGVTKEASYEINVVCELTSITLNTTSATTTFDVGDTFTSEGVVVTAHYKSNNCSDQTVNGFYTVPSDMTTAGTKTVNVSYTENGVTQYASYDITVVQPVYYTVTWIACGDTIQTETYREGAHLVFPTSPGANAGKAFYGWTTTQHYTGTSAPPIISEGGEVHANATYYAVYK